MVLFGCIWKWKLFSRFIKPKNKQRFQFNDVEIRHKQISQQHDETKSEVGSADNLSRLSLDESFSSVKTDVLANMNKSRPKRSNIRRSTRHSRRYNDTNGNVETKKDEQNIKDTKPLSVSSSVLSTANEQVTKPQSSSSILKTNHFSYSSPKVNHAKSNIQNNEFDTQTKDSNSTTNSTSKNSTTKSSASLNSNPMFSSALIAEIKTRQNKNQQQNHVQQEESNDKIVFL